MRYEIGLVGSGGQGAVLMGTILAEAAASIEGLYVAQSRHYDPAVRGGKAQSDLVLSDEEIDYPCALGFDLLLAMSQAGYDMNAQKLKRDALLVADSEGVTAVVGDRILRIPFTRIARSEFGDERATNMIALGAVTKLCQHIPSSAVKARISAIFQGDVLKQNLASFEAGMKYAAEGQKAGFERVGEAEDVEL